MPTARLPSKITRSVSARGDNAKIGTLHGGFEIANGGGPTFSVSGGGLLVAYAFLHSPIEVVVARKAQFDGGFDEGVANWMSIAHVRYRERPITAVPGVATSLLAFRSLEVRQDIGG